MSCRLLRTASCYVPDYLTGEYPSDYGWDCAGLGLAADPKIFKRLRKAEVLHDRKAMLGSLGCLTPELLQKYTAINYGASKGVWFMAGAMIFESDGLNYMGALVLVHAQSIHAVLACQVVLMGAIEAYRVNRGPFGGRDLDLVYPGGKRFDPLGLADDPDVAAELKVKEIKNGHLAMLSMFGYFVPSAVTGRGLVENSASLIADPFAVNRLTLETATQYTPCVAMFATAGKKTAAAPQVDLTGWYGPDRKKWLGPNIADSYVPDYLAGDHPGDYGWDSAGHEADPKTFERLSEAEVLHDCWVLSGA